MIDGLVQIFIWQGIGELVSKFLLPQIPGPVIGLILLVAYLAIKGEVNPELGKVADTFRQHLALLFVPASVGVILFLPELKEHAFAVGTALTVSVILAIAVTALVLKLFSFKEPTLENTKAYRHEMKLLDEDRRLAIQKEKQTKRKKKKAKQDLGSIGDTEQIMTDRLPISEIWVYLSGDPLFALVLTLATYQIGYMLYVKFNRNPILNPAAIAIVLISIVISQFGAGDSPEEAYQQYFEGAKFVHFLLGTATVALAIPIYRGFSQMRGKMLPIFVALTVGSIASIASAVLIAKYMHAGESIVGSMYTKSVTAPIAMGIAERIQVSPTLTAVFTVITGILGAILAPYILDIFKIRPWWIRGTAIGVGAHGLGITRAFSVNEQAGIFASMAMGLNGVLSAIFLPYIYTLLHS